jgi:flagellar hook-length control protein FliK
MGLAVQAPADPLLAIFAEPAAGEGAPGAPPTAEGLFATLLADILDGQLPTGAEEAAPGPALPVATEEPGDQTPDDPALALLASIAALQAVPQSISAISATQPEGSQDAAAETFEATTGPASRAGSILDTAPPATEAAPTAWAPFAEAGSGQATEAPALPEDQSPLPPSGTAAPVEAPAAEVVIEPAGTDIQPPGPPAESARTGPAEAAEPRAGDTAPATEGVVRSVGNASESAPGQGDSHPGRKPEDTRPLPRASANGITHAAPNSAVGQLRQAAPEAPAPEVVDTPAPADPPAELPQQVDQVASAVIERVEAGGGEARIHLEPLELGEVTIHVRTDGDEVRIEIRAERPDVVRLLRDHTQDLSSLLGSRGLNLSDVNVGAGGGNAGSLFEHRQAQPRPVAGEFAAVLGLDDDPSSASRHNRLRAAYNPDGALLYRV